MARNVWRWLQEALFPRFCVSCKQEGQLICRRCKAKWKSEVQVTPDHFAFFQEEDSIARSVIKAWKYDYDTSAKELIEEKIKEHEEELRLWTKQRECQLLIPVPLFYMRYCERGFNQAEEIGNMIARTVQVDCKEDIRRIANTSPQAKKSKAERKRSYARNVFRAKKELENKQVIIVDDIRTTGSTVEAVKQAANKVGANVPGSITLIHIS